LHFFRLQLEPLQEQEKLMKERDRADMKASKERERELARLEAERRKHLERVMREQASGAAHAAAV
jgi:hypothetical protein